MQVTEILVTGYDAGDAVFAVNLVPGAAKVVLTSNEHGEPVVDDIQQHATDAFEAIWEILERLEKVPAGASS